MSVPYQLRGVLREKSSCFFFTESRILPLGFLEEQSKGIRVKELVGRGTWFFITFKAKLSVDNMFVQ